MRGIEMKGDRDEEIERERETEKEWERGKKKWETRMWQIAASSIWSATTRCCEFLTSLSSDNIIDHEVIN